MSRIIIKLKDQGVGGLQGTILSLKYWQKKAEETHFSHIFVNGEKVKDFWILNTLKTEQ